jgi:hypothetical protein
MSLLGIICWSPLWGLMLLGAIRPRVRRRRATRGALERQRRHHRDARIQQLERELEIS